MRLLAYIFCFVFVMVFSENSQIFAQEIVRLEADFSIKTKLPDGSGELIMGTVFYDKNFSKLVYNVHFPNEEVWIMTDTVLCRIAANGETIKQFAPFFAKLSIFHLAMEGNLNDFGLKKSAFEFQKVEKENDMVISTWLPPAKFRNIAGKIMISNKAKTLFGLIIFGTDEKILSKQFFENYSTTAGITFPMQIIQFHYSDLGEILTKTTFKNLKTNNYENNLYYNYPIPD